MEGELVTVRGFESQNCSECKSEFYLSLVEFRAYLLESFSFLGNFNEIVRKDQDLGSIYVKGAGLSEVLQDGGLVRVVRYFAMMGRGFCVLRRRFPFGVLAQPCRDQEGEGKDSA